MCIRDSDGVVAELLPHVGTDDNGTEPAVVGEELDALNAEQAEEGIDRAVEREHVCHDGSQHNPGQEVRQIDNRLERTLENLAAQLIEQDGEGNRNDCIEYQLAKGNHQRVPEDLHAVRELSLIHI